MKRCFINGIGCISAQKTFEKGFLEEVQLYPDKDIIYVYPPDYKSFIPASSLRRLGNGVKNGLAASKIAMTDAQAGMPGAVITGTGLGCMRDSEKFLRLMLDEGEAFLTPTSFVQSTHNTVGGQIALALNCKAYNFNYVNTASSFPSALFDGLTQLQDGEVDAVLAGGVDELADYTTYLYELAGHIRNMSAGRAGSMAGEGASFFYMENQKRQNTYCEVVDICYRNHLEKEKTASFASQFLERNGIGPDEVDIVILGNNGEEKFDAFYDELAEVLQNSASIVYKHLFGEFLTVSGIAVWLACKIFRHQDIPGVLLKERLSGKESFENILIYNQYRGKDHSLILLRNV